MSISDSVLNCISRCIIAWARKVKMPSSGSGASTASTLPASASPSSGLASSAAPASRPDSTATSTALIVNAVASTSGCSSFSRTM